MELPQEFLGQLKSLNVDIDSFVTAMQEPSKKSYFVNTHLISSIDWQKIMFPSTPFPNKPDSYYYTDTKIGLSIPFILGLIYSQEPSAQMVCSFLPDLHDKIVLDMCAAPGGKTCMLAPKSGVVISNEYVSKRVSLLRSNVERLGLDNVCITNKSSDDLSHELEGLCYLTLVDAPCSGEGMFRKDPSTIQEWSIGTVIACRNRQKEILDNASKTVSGGGYLLYSTCTYSIEENEEVIVDFLARHSDFKLVAFDPRVAGVSRDGIVIDPSYNTTLARRFYPMDGFGEGQFCAIMQKQEDVSNKSHPKNSLPKPSTKEIKLIKEFLDKNTSLNDYVLYKVGSNICMRSQEKIEVPLSERGLSCYYTDIGHIEKDRFVPHHQLARVYGSYFNNILSLTLADPRTNKYIRGEQIEDDHIKDGYCAIQVDGYSLSLGKANNGKINNLYPKGLRIVI